MTPGPLTQAYKVEIGPIVMLDLPELGLDLSGGM